MINPATTAPDILGPVDELKDELDRKKQEKAQDDLKGLDDKIKDLEKLVQAAAKAGDGYAGKYEALKAEQKRLETFAANTEPDLVDIIREPGVAAIKAAVKDKVDAVAAKRKEVAGLKGFIPVRAAEKDKFAIGGVTEAEVAVADRLAEHAAAKATLAVYSDLAGAVGARLEGLGKLEKDILKRGQGGQPATAFWLMTRGEKDEAPPAGAAALAGARGVSPEESTVAEQGPETAVPETHDADETRLEASTPGAAEKRPPAEPPDADAAACLAAAEELHALLDELLPKARFFEGGLTAPPQAIPPDEVVSKLIDAWNAEKLAAVAVDAAKVALAAKADALKGAEKALAELEKGLFQAITDAAAEWDRNRVNPDN